MDLRESLDEFYCCAALCDLRMMNKKFVDQNITYSDLLYLELVYNLERMGRPCTASHIAELLYLSKPPVRAKVNELIRKGLLTKRPDPMDNRQYLLSINEDAIPKYRYHRKQDGLAIDKVMEQFSPEDIEKFCQMLKLITDVSFEENDP